jgi:hypothetical protein
MSTARRHHYVSKCYLKSFSVPRKKSRQTTVFDARNRTSYPCSIANVAVEQDFNRIEADGFETDALEKIIAEFESDLAPAIERTTASSAFESQQDRAFILNFMCLTSIRNPRFRAKISRFNERLSRAVMEATLSSRERWEAEKARLESIEGAPTLAMDYDTMKSFHESRLYEITTPTSFHSRMEFEVFDDVLNTFFRRKWVLTKASHTSGGFITSDHPLCLRWMDHRPNLIGPGLGMPRTEVLFPLSTHLALVGAFELDEGVHEVSDEFVAQCNRTIISFAEWQVYARDNHFRFISSTDEIRKANRLLDDPNFKRPRERGAAA